MFTGIVQGKGKIVEIEDSMNFRTYTIQFPAKLLVGLEIGASVANNGCCLSVTKIDNNLVSFDLIKETLLLTNLGLVKIGDMINLERATRYGDEIGGHIISGHISTIAEISKILHSKNNSQIWFCVHKKKLMKYIFYKGFISIDGTSLTVGDIINNLFCVHLIPETIDRTNITDKHIGDLVNIEIDASTQAIVDTVERMMIMQMQNQEKIDYSHDKSNSNSK